MVRDGMMNECVRDGMGNELIRDGMSEFECQRVGFRSMSFLARGTEQTIGVFPVRRMTAHTQIILVLGYRFYLEGNPFLHQSVRYHP